MPASSMPCSCPYRRSENMLALAFTTLSILAAPQPLAKPRVDIDVTSPQLKRKDGKRLFRATKILEVQFDADFPRKLKGMHVLDFKLYTPRGHLYQVLTVPFMADQKKPRK